MKIFEVEDRLGNSIKLSHERWNHMMKHEVPGIQAVKRSFRNPVEIRKSRKDDETVLYYGLLGREYLCVVVQIESGFILSGYKTNYMKEGEVLWTQR